MSTILQTQDLYIEKLQEAKEHLGKHILVAVSYPNGIVFGKALALRAYRSDRWIYRAGDQCNIVVAGIGDMRDFDNVRRATASFERLVERNIGITALTAVGVAKYLSTVYNSFLEEIQSLAAETIISDIRENGFHAIILTSRRRFYTDFVVMGADLYTEPIKPSDLTPEEVDMLYQRVQQQKEMGPCAPQALPDGFAKKIHEHLESTRFVRRPAIAFLQDETGKVPYEKRGKDIAERLVKETLFRFDLPAESNKIQIVVFQRYEESGSILDADQVVSREELFKVFPDVQEKQIYIREIKKEKKNKAIRRRKNRRGKKTKQPIEKR